jgi:hypothetical protein
LTWGEDQARVICLIQDLEICLIRLIWEEADLIVVIWVEDIPIITIEWIKVAHGTCTWEEEMAEECLIAWGTTGVLLHHRRISVTNVALPLQTNSFDVIITGLQMIITVLQMINTDPVGLTVEITMTR